MDLVALSRQEDWETPVTAFLILKVVGVIKTKRAFGSNVLLIKAAIKAFALPNLLIFPPLLMLEVLQLVILSKSPVISLTQICKSSQSSRPHESFWKWARVDSLPMQCMVQQLLH